MHPKIIEIINYIKSKGISASLETNACLLTKLKSEQILESELDFISFSFDGYDKQTYEKIRVNADYEKTLSNILAFPIN